MLRENAVVAACDNHSQAERAVKELERAGFDLKKLSVVGSQRLPSDDVVCLYETGRRVRCRGKLGGFWTSLWEILGGWAFVIFPNTGPLLVAGPLASWIVVALDNASIFGGLSGLGAGLHSIGIPMERIFKCEEALMDQKYLVIAIGSADEVARAKEVLDSVHPAVTAV
jgi:hypothetical protein